MEGGRRAQRDKEDRIRNGGRAQPIPNDDHSRPAQANATLSAIPEPIFHVITFSLLVFGVTFLIVGAIHVKHCSLQPLLPIWLLVLGIIVIFGGVWQAFLIRRIKRNPFRKMSMVEVVVSGILAAFYFGWFIAGNIWVYKAWGNQPDYGHYWYGNSCDKSVFFLSFVAVIIMDALVGVIMIGSCFWCTSKIVVKE